ncbi:MAG: hypothetical protein HQM14_15640 [SAR324 cluster bacterium]|nr:hypothetical protein [SAR324 cluster bacterium]
MSENGPSDSKQIIKLAEQSSKILDSVGPLIQSLQAIGNTPGSGEMRVAIASMFKSIASNVAHMGMKPLQKLLQKMSKITTLHGASKGNEELYVQLLSKACDTLRNALDQIQNDPAETGFYQEIEALFQEFSTCLAEAEKREETPAAWDDEKAADFFDEPEQENPDFLDLATPEDRKGKDAFERFFGEPEAKPVSDYFEDLKNKLLISPDGGSKDGQVISEDGLVFDQASVKEALILCEEIGTFVSDKLTEEQHQVIKSILPFYGSSEELLDYIKLLFTGDSAAKEKTLRIYASKVIGTYNVISLMLKNQEFFKKVIAPESKLSQKELLAFAEAPLKEIKSLLPRSIQDQYTWSRKTLKPNICQILRSREPIFRDAHNHELIAERFRRFTSHLLCDAGIFDYLSWKHEYFKYWLHTELYEMDKRNVVSGKSDNPQYATAKVAAYENLDTIFSALEEIDRTFDHSKQLSQETLEHLKDTEKYFPSLDPFDKSDPLTEPRKREKEMLDSLNVSQIAAFSENVHRGIAAMQSAGQLKGEIPEAMKVRSMEMGNQAKMEKSCQATVLKMQWEHTKKYSKKLSKKMFQTFKGMTGKVNALPKENKSAAKTSQPKYSGGSPLPKAEVEWSGFGKEVRSHIYTPQVLNLQLTFFEHSRYGLQLYPSFQEFIQQVLSFYKERDYLQRVERDYLDKKMEEKHLDEAVYLTIGEGSVIAFGETFFNRPSEFTPYFQLFQQKPVVPVDGEEADWYNRKIGSSEYYMESFQTPNVIRPILFRSMMTVIESLPDELKAHQMIQSLSDGIQTFIENESQL